MSETEEPIKVAGYNYTRIDCVSCSETFYEEGDVTGEVVECPLCGAKHEVEEVL